MFTVVRDVRTIRFWQWFAVQSFAAVGFLAIVLELTDFIIGAVPVRGWPLAVFVVFVAIVWGAFRAWPRPIEQEYERPNTRIVIKKGDIFDESCHIVVGTCDTFDTVPPYISPASVQGQALVRLYGGDSNKMDRELSAALSGKPIVHTLTKPGKTDVYEIGTVATLSHGPRYAYFLAFANMDKNNTAQGTPELLWKSLAVLWDEISTTGNGSTVATTVLGGGLSRLSAVMPTQDAIRFQILSFMFASRARNLCDELRIVVHKTEFEKLDRLELQAFISSLKSS